MSLLCFLGAIYCYKNGMDPGKEYWIIWALFSIADALWLKLGRR